MITAQVTLLNVKGLKALTFNELEKGVANESIDDVFVCQHCGCIHRPAIDRSQPKVILAVPCPDCQSLDAEPLTDENFEVAVEKHWPWRRCQHCHYAFLFDDEIAKELTAPQPGDMGCPACRRLTE